MINNNSYENEFLKFSSSKIIGKSFTERFSQIKNELYVNEERDFDKNVETANFHDNLIDICVSAFGPESTCCKELGYFFLSSDPLYECPFIYDRQVKNFDVLIFNKKEKHAIFVECKSSLTRNGKCVTDAYEAIEQIICNQTYLEAKIGDKIKTMEFVICIPAQSTESLVSEIEKREKNNTINLEKSPPLLIWQVNVFKGQFLQLFTRITSRDKFRAQHQNRKLTNLLGKGYSVDNSEVLVSFYPSSHPFKISAKIVSNVLSENVKTSSENLSEFSLEYINEYCKSYTNIAHYACEKVGQELADRFIRENLAYGLIEQDKDKNNLYRLCSNGKKFQTLLNNYRTEYRKAAVAKLVERKAKKKVVDEFAGKYGSLSTFDFDL